MSGPVPCWRWSATVLRPQRLHFAPVRREAAERVEQYLTDEVNKPMWNRAMMEIYAPGSTFKPATSVAALQSGAITPSGNIIRCKGHEVIGDWLWYCLEKPYGGHGNLTLTEALATSCNLYFFNSACGPGSTRSTPGAAGWDLASTPASTCRASRRAIAPAAKPRSCCVPIRPTRSGFRPTPASRRSASSTTASRSCSWPSTRPPWRPATGSHPYVIDTVTRGDGVVIRDSHPEPVPSGSRNRPWQRSAPA